MKLNQLKALLAKNDIVPRKREDQHFLTDDFVLEREVGYAGITGEDTVLEIGAGPGVLTEKITAKAGKVVVIEKDARFKPILDDIPGVEVIIGDAMEVEWPAFNKFLSNLPYTISSALTFKLLENDFDVAVLCYQKEFADRMVALPGTSDYSRLSVNCSLRAHVELMETVPFNKYWPQPKVNSAIVRLTKKQTGLPAAFDGVCKALFQHKNKKVRNALVDSFHEISSDEGAVKVWVESLWGIKDKRVRELTPGEVVGISAAWI